MTAAKLQASYDQGVNPSIIFVKSAVGTSYCVQATAPDDATKQAFKAGPLADILPGVRERLAPATVLAGVQEGWAEAAGAEVARHSAPVSERGGVVTVRFADDGSERKLMLEYAPLEKIA